PHGPATPNSNTPNSATPGTPSRPSGFRTSQCRNSKKPRPNPATTTLPCSSPPSGTLRPAVSTSAAPTPSTRATSTSTRTCPPPRPPKSCTERWSGKRPTTASGSPSCASHASRTPVCTRASYPAEFSSTATHRNLLYRLPALQLRKRLARKPDLFRQHLQDPERQGRLRAHQVDKVVAGQHAHFGAVHSFRGQRVGLRPNHRRHAQQRARSRLDAQQCIAVRHVGQNGGASSENVDTLGRIALMKENAVPAEGNRLSPLLQLFNQIRSGNKR